MNTTSHAQMISPRTDCIRRTAEYALSMQIRLYSGARDCIRALTECIRSNPHRRIRSHVAKLAMPNTLCRIRRQSVFGQFYLAVQFGYIKCNVKAIFYRLYSAPNTLKAKYALSSAPYTLFSDVLGTHGDSCAGRERVR